VRDAEALLQATAGQTGDKLREVRSRAEETLKQARTSLGSVGGSVEDEALQRVKEVANQAEDYVRANPWQSVGLAAGIGLLVGLMMSRRS
jgi:ElaB/YqjD/DUF883 family membrane-anchored ribosome-binding protein